jgi:TolA-binding protein
MGGPMKSPGIIAIAILLAVTSVASQESRPSQVRISDQTERLQVQVQLLMQDNAGLRKEIAQLEKRLAESKARLAELNDQDVRSGGDRLLEVLASKHGIRIEDYEFQIDDRGEMKFVRRTIPAGLDTLPQK